MGRTSDARERLMAAVGELIWTGSYGATTIDQICERAGVMKGTFYHFFDSKSELAKAAILDGWENYTATLDKLFSPSIPPLERIRGYCRYELKYQVDLKRKYGMVLGCPYCTLGTEISSRDDQLRMTVDEIMDTEIRYIESAIRDAHAGKLIRAPDAAAKAKTVFAYIEGLLSIARIKNNLDSMKEMEKSVLDMLNPIPK